MKDKLEEAARKLARERYDFDGYMKYGSVYAQGVLVGAKWQLASMWIPVEEDQPEEGEKVWVKGGLFDLYPLTFSSGKFWVSLSGKCYSDNVTHWMRIPKFKKGK